MKSIAEIFDNSKELLDSISNFTLPFTAILISDV